MTRTPGGRWPASAPVAQPVASRRRAAWWALGAVAAVALGAAAACSTLGIQAQLTCGNTDVDWLVSVGYKTIDPDRLTVQAGDVICWESIDGATHPLVSDDGTTLSGNLTPEDVLIDTMMVAGTYPYHCVAHAADGETATVTVEPAAAP